MRLLSKNSTTNHSFYNQDVLHPINYLNTSTNHPPPFSFCPIHGPGDAIGNKYGAHAMAMSRLHLGSGARIQRLIHRAMSGQPVTISVLGGSNETDLVILDFDTEDQNDKQALYHFELLIRSLLNRRDSPVIIILGHFSPQTQNTFGFSGPEHQHSVVAQYYDIPHLSVKGVMYHDYLSDPDEYQHSYHADPILANSNGHELLSDVLISYFQHQICRGWDAVWGRAFDVPLFSTEHGGDGDVKGLFGGIRPDGGVMRGAGGQGNKGKAKGDHPPSRNPFRIPQGRIASRPWDVPKLIEAQPFCVAADDLINPLPPSLFYGSGWHVYHPKGGDDNRHYWYSTTPSSKLRIPIRAGAGEVAVYILEESKTVEESASIECWVDDNYGGRKLIRNDRKGEVRPRLIVIDHEVTEGSHYVECQLAGEEDLPVESFKILGIFAT
ncbi:cap64-like protein [Serendipita sp. 399]|nr:cap64-like protein [Serendipita sp. 399]